MEIVFQPVILTLFSPTSSRLGRVVLRWCRDDWGSAGWRGEAIEFPSSNGGFDTNDHP